MRIVKLILKTLFYIVILALVPYIVEGVLHFYDSQYNSMTRPNAIITTSENVHQGPNVRLFNEIRFRSGGLSVKFRCKGLTEIEADSVVNRITGDFTILSEDEYKNNLPGQSYKFKLKTNIKKQHDRVNTRYGGNNVNLTTNFEIDCDLKPISGTDELIQREILLREFEKGEKVYLKIDLDGRVPSNAEFVFSYSKCPRSMLRGTFLDKLDDKVLGFLGIKQ